jgi:hypothetical protein
MSHCSYYLVIRMRFCIFSNLWYLDIVWVEFYVVVNFWDSPFYSRHNAQFFFGLRGIEKLK